MDCIVFIFGIIVVCRKFIIVFVVVFIINIGVVTVVFVWTAIVGSVIYCLWVFNVLFVCLF